MKKRFTILVFLMILLGTVNGQDKFMTRIGYIKFFSHATLEEIEAQNNEVSSVINIKTGEMAFVVLMKSFKFKNALMEEHFNENYIQSDQFPKAKFKGNILEIETIDLTKNGSYQVTINGTLEIHGITQNISEKGVLDVNGSKIKGTCKFNLAIKDYGIVIEMAKTNNIAEIVEVTVEMNYELLK